MVSELRVSETSIPGLLIIDLPVQSDSRGWFKENWQREKMTALGLPDFTPVQNNVSFNNDTGVTRGVHAEPWDKLVSVVAGEIFGAWVDLREGSTFGQTVTLNLSIGQAVFVPRGVGNAYQTLKPNTAYSYLVNEHWSESAKGSYTFLNLDDPDCAIPWPIPLAQAIRSEADITHPRLSEVRPFGNGRMLILGATGQLGRALQQTFPEAEALGRNEVDLTALDAFDWSGVDYILNAGAYTAVDAAEIDRARAWQVNVTSVRELVQIARQHRAVLVHISSDYVFDGTKEKHSEDEPMSPLGFYGATKAAADELVATWDRHYIVRTSWVVGDGRNFVATMADLADRNVSPSVVNDQFGRLTFTDTLSSGIAHLIKSRADFGTYNLTNSGAVCSWAEIATEIYRLRGTTTGTVIPVRTRDYEQGKTVSPRPRNSTLALDKIREAGFEPPPPPLELHLAAVPNKEHD